MLPIRNLLPNTIWKQLASGKPSNASLDKAKSILCKEKARDWNAVGRVEDGYKDTEITKKNQTSLEKGYESDYPSPSKPSSKYPFKVHSKVESFGKHGRTSMEIPFTKS